MDCLVTSPARSLLRRVVCRPGPPRTTSSAARVVAFALLTAIAAPGRAQPPTAPPAPPPGPGALPFSAEVEVGHPARSTRVSVERRDDALSIELSREGRQSQHTLRADGSSAALEVVEVAPDHRLAILRVAGSDTETVALIGVERGAPTVLFSGRTDLHGDPGERIASVISVEDRTGDGRPDVLTGVRREGVDVCGSSETVLLGRAYDPAAGRLRPVVLRRVTGADADPRVVATRDSPGPTGAPLIAGLEARGASSTSGVADEPESALEALAPPRALVDGDPATFWAEGRGGPGVQEFVTFQWNARFPIRALAVTVAPSGTVRGTLGRPRGFWLVGDDGARIRVDMPEDAGQHAGERYWVVPPAPLSWRCASLVLDTAYGGRNEDSIHTGFAEVEAYTELDFGGGIDALVNMIVSGGSNGEEAARLLLGLGEPAVQALLPSWERLDTLGHRRATRVFANAARHDWAGGLDGLALAARDDAPEVRAQALEALGTIEAGAELLADRVLEPAPRGDEAVGPLVHQPASVAVPALLRAMGTDGGSERPALRVGLAEALAREARAHEEDGAAAYAAWAEAEPPVGAYASAALGLASRSATRRDVSAARWVAAARRAERFEDRWRLVRAGREIGADPEGDAWLAEVAGQAEEWMLRAAAVEALARRQSNVRGAVARAALADETARVRVEAIRILASDAEATDALANAAREDAWPMVRAAAVEGLFQRTEALPVVRRAVRDRSALVRAAAIGTLTRAGDRAAAPLVRARMSDDDEWPRVTVAALRYAAELCVPEAGEDVLTVLRRGIRPDAWAPDVDVAALAMVVALRLGGSTREDASRIAARESTPASVRAAAARGAGPACRPGGR
ncbi:MAG: HEAT repeat domain-containing protein [Sandaracinaceae bacterium]